MNFLGANFSKEGLTLTGSSVALGAVESASAATSNSIVTENKLTGTAQSQWDLSGEGQYSGFGLGDGQTPMPGVTNYLEGFADNMSVNHGQTINFKINTNCKNYRIDIYRLGYYAGLGARKITTISMTSASVQPTPLTNLAIGLVDAGNWSVTTSWAVPATAVSGVYIAHLVRQDTVAGENHITFVVRDDDTLHDIVFQTSDLTWQAYNGWGGYNLYGGGRISVRPAMAGPIRLATIGRLPLAMSIGIVSGLSGFCFRGRNLRHPLAGGQRLRCFLYRGRRHGPQRLPSCSNTKFFSRSGMTSTGRAVNAPMWKRRALRVCTWRS